MELNVYQEEALKTAVYPNKGNNFTYPALGVCGEAGEIADKLKKVIRDNGGVLTTEVIDAVEKEIGDCLWYLAAVSVEIGRSLESAAIKNLAKLKDRAERGVIQGSGDNR